MNDEFYDRLRTAPLDPSVTLIDIGSKLAKTLSLVKSLPRGSQPKIHAIRPALNDYDKKHLSGPGWKSAVTDSLVTYAGPDFVLSAANPLPKVPNPVVFAHDCLYYTGVQEAILAARKGTLVIYTALVW